MIGRIYNSWAVRHRHPVNYVLHLFGIPMAVAGVVLLFFQAWLLAAVLFVAGYALQFLGHAIEGNEVGEITLIKSLFKRSSS